MPSYHQRNNKPTLAYNFRQAENSDKPAIVFCGGYRSDMEGTKAVFIEQQAIKHGHSTLRFDYSGHGESEGVFEDLTISDWRDDARDIITHCLTQDGGRVQDFIIIGSSMGGWISLLQARMPEFQSSLKGLIGIAAAPDFTEDMYHTRLTPAQQAELIDKGIVYIPNDYSDTPYSFTRKFFEDGKTNLTLPTAANHKLPCPAIFLQGTADKDVPPQTARDIQTAYALPDEAITLIENGDHRLSSPDQLEAIWAAIETILKTK